MWATLDTNIAIRMNHTSNDDLDDVLSFFQSCELLFNLALLDSPVQFTGGKTERADRRRSYLLRQHGARSSLCHSPASDRKEAYG